MRVTKLVANALFAGGDGEISAGMLPTMTIRATFNGTVVAESDDTIVVEGNHHFSPEAVRSEYLRPSESRTTCSWKGQASYHDVVVDGERAADGAWYYADPKDAAKEIKDRLAFWKGVVVE
jgi:uncharacterized protein (DUF427 family)